MPVLIEEDEAADLILLHQLRCLVHVLVCESVDHVRGHDVSYFAHVRSIALGNRAYGDVAVGNHAHEPFAFAEGKGPDIQGFHALGSFLERAVGMNRLNGCRHQIFHLHELPPSIASPDAGCIAPYTASWSESHRLKWECIFSRAMRH